MKSFEHRRSVAGGGGGGGRPPNPQREEREYKRLLERYAATKTLWTEERIAEVKTVAAIKRARDLERDLDRRQQAMEDLTREPEGEAFAGQGQIGDLKRLERHSVKLEAIERAQIERLLSWLVQMNPNRADLMLEAIKLRDQQEKCTNVVGSSSSSSEKVLVEYENRDMYDNLQVLLDDSDPTHYPFLATLRSQIPQIRDLAKVCEEEELEKRLAHLWAGGSRRAGEGKM
eukprot:PhM_4_TR7218/c1_g1_i1/m.104099